MKKNSNIKSPLKCSLFYPENTSPKKIVIYCHSFSGNILEGRFLLDFLLPDICVLLFDFRGCGNNMSKFVTLGLRESEDLYCVVRELYKRYELESLGFWGRSMGAVTIIHFLHTIESKFIIHKNKEEKLKKRNSNKGKSKTVDNKIKEVEKKENVVEKKKEKKIEENSNIQKTKKDKNLKKHMSEKLLIERKLSEHIIKQEKKILKNAKKHSIRSNSKTSSSEYAYITHLKSLIKCIVLDSPFPDSYKMIKGILKNQSNISSIIAKIMLFPVRRSIRNSTGYDVLGLNKPEKKVELLKFPGIFLIGELDDLIDKNEFKKMFDNYKGFLKR